MFRVQESPTEAAKTDRLIGKLVSDRYRIIRKIGEGGMGTVYECMHEAIEKRIALKVLHAEYSSSAEVVHRFKQEAISASRIKHQNVIDVFDFGQLGDGSCFIAMEYLEGMDLGGALEKYGHFTPERALRVIIQVARALGLGHARGVIHRDLKPENVFLQLTPEGDEIVKIVDFGIAQLRNKDDADAPSEAVHRPKRLTKTGMIFGTPEYMAPEQARGRAIDQRADIYATGVILYELLTGAVPFLGESFLEVLNQHVQSKVPPVGEVNPDVKLSPELQRAVHKALEKDPDDRYPDMKAFTQRLLSTPEGRAARALTSSMSGAEAAKFPEEEDPSMRVENSRYPKAASTEGTAMFGSPGQESLFEEPPVLPTHISKVPFYLGGLAVVGLGLFAFLSLGDRSTDKTSPKKDQATAASAAPSSSAEAPVKEPEEKPEDLPEPTPTEALKITLSVSTDPEGGVLFKDGFQVCDNTPCDVQVSVNEAVTLSAEKAGAKGEAKVLAQKDQSVIIKLKALRAPSPRPAPAPAPTPKNQLCEVMVDGIKILRPCE